MGALGLCHRQLGRQQEPRRASGPGGQWPQAAPLFPSARRQRPSVSRSRPCRVGSGGVRAGSELSPGATKPTPRDISNLPSSLTSTATVAWGIGTSVLTGSPHVGSFPSQVTVTLCHGSSHMTSSLRNLRSLPGHPVCHSLGPAPRAQPCHPVLVRPACHTAGISRCACERTEGTLWTLNKGSARGEGENSSLPAPGSS